MSRTAMLMLVALLAVGLAAAQGSPVGSDTAAQAKKRAKRKPVKPRPAPKNNSVRAGCSQFCQQAGGFGAGGEPPPNQQPAIKILTTGSTTVTSDGAAIPVEFQCLFRNACQGLLLVNLDKGGPEIARADLLVGAHQQATLEIPLTAEGRKALGQAPTVQIRVTAFAFKTQGIDTAPDFKFTDSKTMIFVLRLP